ncbi:MAG: ubiquinone/menaquinone biosynthesis methyltransferase [Bacillota bacterium]
MARGVMPVHGGNRVPPSLGKAEYVRGLFDEIAYEYDRLNQVISMGQWHRWHKVFLGHTRFSPGDQILDLACGTGDLSLLSAASVYPGGRVVGIDFSERMLEVGRMRVARSPYGEVVDLMLGDAMELALPDNSFDGITMGWAMRNVASIPQTLAEAYRVLKPGGRFICMDAAKPYNAFWRTWFIFYWKSFLPAIDRFFIREQHRRGSGPYTYLSQSLDHYPMPHELEQIFRQAGFGKTQCHLLNLGTVAIHIGTKGR